MESHVLGESLITALQRETGLSAQSSCDVLALSVVRIQNPGEGSPRLLQRRGVGRENRGHNKPGW